MMTNFTRAIIAGGMSRRMGMNKAFLEVGGGPIVERILQRTDDCRHVGTLIITNAPELYEHFGYPIFTDAMPDKGSLGGIYTALLRSPAEYVFVTACDMPFVSGALWRFMLTQAEGYQAVVPRVEGYPQGLHALYHRDCLVPIEARLQANKLKVIGFYDDVSVRYLDEGEYAPYADEGRALMNVNTPEELEQARMLDVVNRKDKE